MRTYNNIIYEKKDLIGEITINRPNKRNALNLDTMVELSDAFQVAENDKDIGVVVLTGAGDKAFCAGADLDYFNGMLKDPNESWRMIGQFNRMTYNIRTMGKPIISKINGICIGGGFELIIMTDFIIAAEHANFIAGESAVGLVPCAGSTQFLTAVVGDKRARWALYTDEPIIASRAYEWGLVNKVVPKEQLDEEVDMVCNILLNKSMWSLRYLKTSMNVWIDLVQHTFNQGRDAWTLNTMLPDATDACAAFAEKKSIDWIERRRAQSNGDMGEYRWGHEVKCCPHCYTKYIPSKYVYCGICGKKFD